MLNLAQLTKEQFIRPATLEAIKHEADDLIDHLMAPEAKKIAEQIEEKLKSLAGLELRAPEIYHQYQALVIQLKFIALPCLDNDSVLELIKNNFFDILVSNIDINERMTGKMYSIPDLIWPDFAGKIIAALKENSQRISQQPIIIKGETTSRPPTIKNWLSDYDRIFGPEKHSYFEQEEYLAKNQNAKILIEEDKNKLRNLLKFYNNLKPLPLSAINDLFKKLGLEKEIGIKEITPPPPSGPARPIPPTRPSLARPSVPPSEEDIYREAIPEKPDEPIPSPPSPPPPPSQPKPTPRVEGNIVDLKNINE